MSLRHLYLAFERERKIWPDKTVYWHQGLEAAFDDARDPTRPLSCLAKINSPFSNIDFLAGYQQGQFAAQLSLDSPTIAKEPSHD